MLHGIQVGGTPFCKCKGFYKFIKEQTLILKMVFEDFIQLVLYVNVQSVFLHDMNNLCHAYQPFHKD